METDWILNNKRQLLEYAPDVVNYNNLFKAMNRRWGCAITAGRIEANAMVPEAARLFKPLIEDMCHTKELYGKTQEQLVDAILVEMSRKVVSQLIDAAKFTINILKRNLFERTADVGYLATDSEIVNFLKQCTGSTSDEDPAASRNFIQNRLSQYQYEYTVYNEILILDTRGNVLAGLDTKNPVSHSNDPLLSQTLAIDPHHPDQYLETFRETDLCPGRGNVLIYSQKIQDPDDNTSLGVLCLCFDFEDEARRIFDDLGRGHIISTVLDESGRVMFSSNPSEAPVGKQFPVDMEGDFQIINCSGKACFITTVPTDGYQGFYGLPWYGMAMINTRAAFEKKEKESKEIDLQMNLENFSKDLAFLRKESEDLLGAMKIDGINGVVQAAKFRANAFVKVLHFVKEIGENINGLFSEAIENLQDTIATSLFSDVEFRAFQGNNIADRNLYERANDVCWWALTPLFRTLLAKHADAGLDSKEKEKLKANLQYINNLYTPYLRLVLTDKKGMIVAVSNPPDELEEKFESENLPAGQDFVGTYVDEDLLKKTLILASTKDYCVSEFQPTQLYGDRHTYIYSTAVRDPSDSSKPVGSIQIVFDSEPQFFAMLSDVLPRDENNTIVKGSFSVFADRDKKVISSTSPEYPPGSFLPLEDKLFQYEKGERDSTIVNLNGAGFAAGLQVSAGYREYKIKDGYENDVICLVFVPV